jgi:hypothetical protein
MADINFGIIALLVLFAAAMLFLIIPLTITYFMNKKQITEDQRKRQITEISQAKPFADIAEAKQHATSESRKIIWSYGAYFVIVVPILVYLFGKVQYGPNLPYLVVLAVTGIPWIACFLQSLLLAEKQRLRLQASSISAKPGSVYFVNGIMLAPGVLLALIVIVFRISNQVLR